MPGESGGYGAECVVRHISGGADDTSEGVFDMRHHGRAGIGAVLATSALFAAACGGDDSSSSAAASGGATSTSGAAASIGRNGRGNVVDAAAAGLPTSMDEWEALWAKQRAAIVKRIKDNKWGKSADGKTLDRPRGLHRSTSPSARPAGRTPRA